jgi:hypothetical protein
VSAVGRFLYERLELRGMSESGSPLRKYNATTGRVVLHSGARRVLYL